MIITSYQKTEKTALRILIGINSVYQILKNTQNLKTKNYGDDESSTLVCGERY